MFKKAKPFFIKVITPLHAGSGQDVGFVDMPIQRERHTNYPKIEGSSLKGSIREVFEELNLDKKNIYTVFGPESNNSEEDYASAIGFVDARILLFPVKSVSGVFAYITSPDVVNRFLKDLKITGEKIEVEEVNKNTVTNNTNLIINNSTKIVLEEYLFDVAPNSETEKLASYLSNKLNDNNIKHKLVVIDNDSFKHFVSMYTEVITRTKISAETGTVEEGALFTEEYLPAETILYSIVLNSPPRNDKSNIKTVDDVLNFFISNIPEVIQIGGNATIGKGIVKIFI